MISDTFARTFVQRIGLADTAGLLDQHGRATEGLRQRAERAVIARTYGVNPVIAALIDGRAKLKGVTEALLFASPFWAAMRSAAQENAISADFEITADLVEAIRHANVARQSHLTAIEYLEQGSVEEISPVTRELIRLFADDAALLAEGLKSYAYDAVASGSHNMFGQSSPAEVLAAALRKAKPLEVAPKRRKSSSAMFGESGHRRIAADAYHTIDADWIVPALLSKLDLRGPVFEPSAGKGHLVDALSAARFAVTATDLIDYGRSDITPGVDLFSLTPQDLAGAGSIVCNLPYDLLGEATAHLLDIASPHGLQVASLVRAEWPIAKSRRSLIHQNPHFDRVIYLTRRPRWVVETKASPRHWFAWCAWDFQRDPTQPPTVSFAP
jgi:hypothetical protein